MAHTNSVAKVFQCLLLTGNRFRLLVFGTNLIAFCCQCSLARSATAHGHCSLADHFLVARSTSASPSPSLLPGRRACAVATTVTVDRAVGELACQRRRAQPASSFASAFSPSPPPACHHSHCRHSSLLALSSMLQASLFSLAARPPPARDLS